MVATGADSSETSSPALTRFLAFSSTACAIDSFLPATTTRSRPTSKVSRTFLPVTGCVATTTS
jgi:hypothetical protein